MENLPAKNRSFPSEELKVNKEKFNEIQSDHLEQKKKQAMSYKNKGNEYYNFGNFKLAIKEYEKAIVIFSFGIYC